MPDVLLFGASGYTGRLTAHALHRRGIDFAVAGRDHAKLAAISAATGRREVRVADASDLASLVRHLRDVKVLITCVGPFDEIGDTAAEAALIAGAHYIDCNGETSFTGRLIERYDGRARAAGIAMAPALGFDEVPADVIAAVATESMDRPSLTLTYALPTTASRGTVRSSLGIIASEGRWIEDGKPVAVGAGEKLRWAPMPPPLGPRTSMAFPLAEAWLAPRHIDLADLELYVTSGAAQSYGIKAAVPALRFLRSVGPGRSVLKGALARLPDGPAPHALKAGRWTILAEARDGSAWRNVTATGNDVYGVTAETLALGAATMAAGGYARSGVLSPVQAVRLDPLREVLIARGTAIEVHAPIKEGVL